MTKINRIVVSKFRTIVIYNSWRRVNYFHTSECKLPKTVEEFIRTHPKDVIYLPGTVNTDSSERV